MNFALAQQRNDRHPVGLLIVIGLHVLLALAMLSARLQVESPPPPQAPLTKIDPPEPPQAGRAHDLPGAPRAALRAMVAPVPEVVVDSLAPIRTTTQESPSVPVPAPMPATTTRPAPGPGPQSPGAAGLGDGAQGGIGREEGVKGWIGLGNTEWMWRRIRQGTLCTGA